MTDLVTFELTDGVADIRFNRPDKHNSLALTGRIVEVEEAQALGLVTRIEEDPRAAAFALAHSIAARSPDAVRAAKRLLHAAWRADPRTGLAMEEGIQFTLLGTPNQLEAVNSGLENRCGRFVDS